MVNIKIVCVFYLPSISNPFKLDFEYHLLSTTSN